MKIATEKANEYIEQFVKGCLIQEAKQPLTKFKLGFIYGSGSLKLTPQKVVEMLNPLGIADADGNIEIELLKKATESGMDAAGELHIPMLGIHLQRSEIDKFFRLVETGALS